MKKRPKVIRKWPIGTTARKGEGVQCHCHCCSTLKLNKRKPVIFRGGYDKMLYLNCMRCVLQVVQRSREAVRVVIWSTLCQKRKNTDKRSSVNSVAIGNALHIPPPHQGHRSHLMICGYKNQRMA